MVIGNKTSQMPIDTHIQKLPQIVMINGYILLSKLHCSFSYLRKKNQILLMKSRLIASNLEYMEERD